MLKACLAWAFFCLVFVLPVRAFDWETATINGRDYVSLHSFCSFYQFAYQYPSGNDRFVSRNAAHSISLKDGTSDMYLDGVHYVMSFPIEKGDHDWLISRMDVIKLLEPILRPTEISGRHTIRGVVIDAGHGGTDNGATSRLGAEKNYTLDTAFRLRKILQDAGLKVVFTRSNDVFVDLYERAHIASLYPDYAFVSIHFNSATPEARGLETYCLSPRGAASTSSNYLTRSDIQKLPGNDYDTQNILLASCVHSEIIKLNPGDQSADRGVKRARFVVIKQNVLPAILVEGGFVSNHMESQRVDRGDYRQALATDIARGVIRFINDMGDRSLSLPGMGRDDDGVVPSTKNAPKAIPVAPPAPSGLAHDSSSVHTPATPSGTTTQTGTTTSSHKKKKKGAAATATPPTTLAPAPTPAPTPDTTPPPPASTESVPPAPPTPAPSTSSAPSSPLNLTEPTTPTPSPGPDKSPAEPDEPPTVNIYPTTPAAAPKSSDSAPAPSSSAPASTNAAPKPADPQP
jgi:N-acetylmuramoyl-L-alanine amidase